MKTSIRFTTLAALLSLISSCAFLQNFQKPVEIDSLDRGVKLDYKAFFTGDIEGFAIVQDQNGKIISTQTSKINGKWEGNKGVIQQNFTLNNGDKDSRTWLVTLNDNGTFDAIGHDISAPAKGKTVGNAAQVTYGLLLPGVGGEKQEVKYEDRMYLVDEKSMIMISNIKKGYSSSEKAIFSLRKLNNIAKAEKFVVEKPVEKNGEKTVEKNSEKSPDKSE